MIIIIGTGMCFLFRCRPITYFLFIFADIYSSNKNSPAALSDVLPLRKGMGGRESISHAEEA